MMYLLILVPVLVAIVLVVVWQLKGKHQDEQALTQSLTTLNTRSPLTRPSERAAAVERMVIPEVRNTGDAKVMLIVDDQPAIRMLLREVFELEGLAVYESAHGQAALELIRKTHIDFVLLDLKMPDMDGLTVLRGIRRISADVKVAMITAYSDPLQLEESNRLGVLTHFTKPFDIGTVKKFVLEHL